MDPRDVTNAEQVRAIVEKRGLNHVKVGVFDIDGILRGKYMARDKFFSALDKGFGFCDVIVGWDSHDQLYDNVTVTGWHRGYPDASVEFYHPVAERYHGKTACCYSSANLKAITRPYARGPCYAAFWTGPTTWALTSSQDLNTSSLSSKKRPIACARKTTEA